MSEKEPEYLICRQCETPCYQFEYKLGKILTAFCTACGMDEVDEFEIPQED